MSASSTDGVALCILAAPLGEQVCLQGATSLLRQSLKHLTPAIAGCRSDLQASAAMPSTCCLAAPGASGTALLGCRAAGLFPTPTANELSLAASVLLPEGADLCAGEEAAQSLGLGEGQLATAEGGVPLGEDRGLISTAGPETFIVAAAEETPASLCEAVPSAPGVPIAPIALAETESAKRSDFRCLSSMGLIPSPSLPSWPLAAWAAFFSAAMCRRRALRLFSLASEAWASAAQGASSEPDASSQSFSPSFSPSSSP
eukprot:CAMPEP_0170648218 /NCGR_PEP_ID=MMETSP0224-20130122/44624_1 /TAXON_ID=285029 /ORGANISM="Togula jolla, Strain CCCM 725" /LENGTH=257 /DNA_ID=CAMNT_0010979743 /DNA_START=17 /DNA_END=789 /DNA_ORIENTATION=+